MQLYPKNMENPRDLNIKWITFARAGAALLTPGAAPMGTNWVRGCCHAPARLEYVASASIVVTCISWAENPNVKTDGRIKGQKDYHLLWTGPKYVLLGRRRLVSVLQSRRHYLDRGIPQQRGQIVLILPFSVTFSERKFYLNFEENKPWTSEQSPPMCPLWMQGPWTRNATQIPWHD